MASDTRTMSPEGPSAVSRAAAMGSDKGQDDRPLALHSITPLISALGATDFYAQFLMRLGTPSRYILWYGLNYILAPRRQCTTHSKSSESRGGLPAWRICNGTSKYFSNRRRLQQMTD
ncbi:hypothetical protein QQF64_018660 [Cirrhinus molitorella]|uniref:Uncharacterized protein n=1 Tax=Cirrhinus molitorella TaxID=172907 RepID=A0ABR3LD93_9TELE